MGRSCACGATISAIPGPLGGSAAEVAVIGMAVTIDGDADKLDDALVEEPGCVSDATETVKITN